VFNLVTGIIPPDTGSVRLSGVDVTTWRPHAIVRAGIGRTFQNIRLFEGLTVLDNVKAALCGVEAYGFAAALLATPRARRVERQLTEIAQRLLEQVDMPHLAEERPQNLPYGSQRRLEIARALATSPSLLLLDEPAAGLNPSEVVEIVELIRHLREQLGIAIFLIEHHMDVVMPICEEVYVLNMGRTIARGTPEHVQNHPDVLRAYLGE
jgi:branched-chain amino acid transport system ATP-binding protein